MLLRKMRFLLQANQAALAHINSLTAGIYSERRFLLQELSLYQLAVALPTSSGNFGVSASYFGSAQNNESVIGLAYGRKLGEKVSIGAQFNYVSMQVAGYGNASTINFEAGSIVAYYRTIAGRHPYLQSYKFNF